MGTMTPAAKRKKPGGPIVNSRPYQWLARQEKAGKLKKFGFGSPGTPGAGIERRMDKAISPVVKRWKKKVNKAEAWASGLIRGK